MKYFEVLVGDPSLKELQTFAYSYPGTLKKGSIVKINFKNKNRLGIAVKQTTTKPMKVKPILESSTYSINKQVLDLIDWFNEYYPCAAGPITQLFLPSSIRELSASSDKGSVENRLKKLPQLTEEQKNAIKKINETNSHHIYIHGETGTGKTRVYQELARKTLENKQSVLILVPEITLSPQLANEFKKISKDVVIIHSKQSTKQRAETWWKIAKSKTPIVVVGTRSSLFAPFTNLGLIVVDEAHDSSYKQSQSPYYDARRLSAKIAVLFKIKVVYGSATPDIADLYRFKKHNLPIIRMVSPINKEIKKPIIYSIDSKNRANFSQSAFISNEAIKKISTAIAANQQSLVFLNRRGTARIIICDDCGWLSTCPNCDTNLVFHNDNFLAICHICGYRAKPHTNCPECNGANISFKSRGTKSIVDEMQKLFFQAKIMRFDSDNNKTESLENNFEKIEKGGVDIIVGTQIIAKGLHIPNLTVVFVPFAESGVFLPDFTSEERAFQLTRQVIGRVGRTEKDSAIIVQSFSRKKNVIDLATKNQWQEFYDSQITHRKKYGFPPFYYLLQISIKRKTKAGAKSAATKLANSIKEKNIKEISVLGPSPRFYEKSGAYYNWQIIIKSKSRPTLTKIIKSLPSGWRANIDPINLL